MRRNVTLKDVAAAAGVSDATVSRVLAGKSAHYSRATRDRVMKAVRRLGYRLHMAPAIMRKGSYGTIALIISEIADGRSRTPEPLIRGACAALESRNMHLSILTLSDEKLTDPDYVPSILRTWLADGLLLNYNKQIPERMIELIEEYRIPAIWLNYKADCNCVYPNDYAAGQQAAQRLIAVGHRRLVYLNNFVHPERRHYSDRDRADGFVEGTRASGGQAVLIEYETLGGQRPTEVCLELFRRSDRPTAVAAYSHVELMALMPVVGHLGLEVPRDLSILCFDDYPGRFHFLGGERRVDVMKTPHFEVGVRGVEALLLRLQRGRPEPAHAVPFAWQPGETIAPPPEK